MELVGPMNNVFMHYSQKTDQQLRLKKKKKRENADAACLSAIQTYTKQGSSGCYHLYKIYLISFIQGQFHFSLLNPYS